MKIMLKMFLAVVSLFIFTGCSIKQEVQPVGGQVENEIAIIKDSAVREGVLQTYTAALQSKGYIVNLLPDGSAIPKTGLSSKYYALWSWDLAIYMSYLVIDVFRDGVLIGKATYDSRSGSASFGKWVKGEEKIKELVNTLFPGRAGSFVQPKESAQPKNQTSDTEKDPAKDSASDSVNEP